MNKQKFLAVLVVALVSGHALAGDLDSPGAKPVTVRSEIYRGEMAAAQSRATRGVIQFQESLSRTEKLNEQGNTDSHGYLLGFHLQAWQSLWYVLGAGLYKGPELDFAIVATDEHYEVFRAQRKMLELTPEQISECAPPYSVADDELWEKARANKKFRGTFPHPIK